MVTFGLHPEINVKSGVVIKLTRLDEIIYVYLFQEVMQHEALSSCIPWRHPGASGVDVTSVLCFY